MKPLDIDTITEALGSHPFAIVLEDANIEGGIGEKISSLANREGINSSVSRLGIPDRFIPHGTVRELWDHCGLVPEEVLKVHEIFKKR